MATAIDPVTHATLITKAEKIGIDADFFDDVESLKAACRQASEKTAITRIAELSIEEKKLSSPLYVAKELGKSFNADDYDSAEKYMKLESQFQQTASEIKLTEAFSERLLKKYGG